ncbi:anti-sigma factor [Puniceibacterium confluentis]|uniref:anti-sigma factor n=1 Tax=Puniceibacterium confluentis TaxID=1958944 RepID=UPI0011B551E4|nr:hypothetical protein [Puniceibacterium confluentis]
MTGRSDDSDRPPPDLSGTDSALCAEYVLNLLSDDEARAFERRLEREPVLQTEVTYWAEHFADISDSLPEVAPAAAVLRRIETEIFGTGRQTLWRALLPYLLGALVAAALAWVVNTKGLLNTAPPAPDLYADLVAADSGLALQAHYAPDTGVLTLRGPVDDLPPGRVLVVWVHPADGGGPVVLGPLETGVPGTLYVPEVLWGDLAGATLVISDLAADAATASAPTGRELARGTLTPG